MHVKAEVSELLKRILTKRVWRRKVNNHVTVQSKSQTNEIMQPKSKSLERKGKLVQSRARVTCVQGSACTWALKHSAKERDEQRYAHKSEASAKWHWCKFSHHRSIMWRPQEPCSATHFLCKIETTQQSKAHLLNSKLWTSYNSFSIIIHFHYLICNWLHFLHSPRVLFGTGR